MEFERGSSECASYNIAAELREQAAVVLVDVHRAGFDILRNYLVRFYRVSTIETQLGVVA